MKRYIKTKIEGHDYVLDIYSNQLWSKDGFAVMPVVFTKILAMLMLNTGKLVHINNIYKNTHILKISLLRRSIETINVLALQKVNTDIRANVERRDTMTTGNYPIYQRGDYMFLSPVQTMKPIQYRNRAYVDENGKRRYKREPLSSERKAATKYNIWRQKKKEGNTPIHVPIERTE